MKILTISTLYPNDKEPKHGIFVRNRLKHLREHFPDVEAKVIAPVPWFPFRVKSGPFSEYAKFVGVSPEETRDGIQVLHPRYLVIPKIGMYLTPIFLYFAMRSAAKKLSDQGFNFDLIDGHYFFPDGVAIQRLAKAMGKPYTVTARGTDVNFIPQFPRARKMIMSVAQHAAAAITVCRALKDSLVEFADVEDKTTVLRNGVDLTFFTPTDKHQQEKLKIEKWKVSADKKLIISVGHLIERKGHSLVIESLHHNEDWDLIIAGDGPDITMLESMVANNNLQGRVRFAGALEQGELKELYQAADVLVLASSREGWANVLLESMACGTSVVATNLWGTPEVVAAEEAGVLVERHAKNIAEGIESLVSRKIERAKTRRYAECFDWHATSKGQYDIFNQIINTQQLRPATVPVQISEK